MNVVYVLIVVAWMGPHHERSFATHDYNNLTTCQTSAAALQKEYKSLDMRASCQPKGHAI